MKLTKQTKKAVKEHMLEAYESYMNNHPDDSVMTQLDMLDSIKESGLYFLSGWMQDKSVNLKEVLDYLREVFNEIYEDYRVRTFK